MNKYTENMYNLNDLEIEFKKIFTDKIKRDGADKLLDWICKSDFFSAPASTKFHLNIKGGLLIHSLNVYHQFVEEAKFLEDKYNVKYSDDTIALLALCHDLCKCDFYDIEFRNAKDEFDNWVKKPFYIVNDKFPMGHGEKSLFIVNQFVKLTGEEALAIRWHMGGADEAVRGGSYAQSQAFNKSYLIPALHIADLKATFYDEV